MIRKIVSGGQTGVDRAALDVAIELGIDHGGWCPRGRIAEDGMIDIGYKLKPLKKIQSKEQNGMFVTLMGHWLFSLGLLSIFMTVQQ